MALPRGFSSLPRYCISGDSRGSSASERDQQELIALAAAALGVAPGKPLKGGQRTELVSVVEQGEDEMLGRLRERMDRAGFSLPSVEVAWGALHVERAAVSAADSLPSLLQPFGQLLRPRPGRSTVLHPTTGVLRPGSFTLLLGPPGSGRSSLLQALSGRLQPSKLVGVSGSLRYNGCSPEQFSLARTAAYVDQVDLLIPTLTARETLQFSEACGGRGDHLQRAMQQMLAWEAAHPQLAGRTALDDKADKLLLSMLDHANLLTTEWCLTILGLQHVGDTLVGGTTLRGVSGGERRRVAVGQGIVGPAMVLALDEPSTGLDSASTFALAASMQRWARLLNTTIVMALLQPEPPVVALFDDIILLGEGRVLWHGPTAQALPHFAGLGLRPLPGMPLAEFLQQLAVQADQAQLLAGAGRDADATMSPEQLSLAFWASGSGQGLKAVAEASLAMQPTQEQLASLESRTAPVPWRVVLAACTRRLLKVELERNWQALCLRWLLAVFMALITGLLFLQLPLTFLGGVNMLGMLFQGIFFLQVLSVATVELTYSKRPIQISQRDQGLVPSWVEWLPATLLNAPVLLVDVFAYGTPVYWLLGFTPAPQPFFTFVLVMFAFCLMCDNLYRVYGGAAKVLSTAIGIGVVHGLANEMLAGFVITPGKMPAWWAWFLWVNPCAYAFRALAINELKQPRWAAAPSAQPGLSLGDAVLSYFEVDATWSWVWGGVGVLLGMACFCAVAALLAFAFAKLPERPAVLPAQQQEEGRELRGLQAKQHSAAVHKKGVSALGTTAAASDTAVTARDAIALQLALEPGVGSPAGVSVAFQQLCYFVPHPGGKRQGKLQLLHGITGAFKPGRLTALMGGSGAGKTTLLDCIAGRKTAGRVSGSICVAGQPQASTAFAQLSGYVEQNDIHAPLATVSEALTFSAALRCSDSSRAGDVAGRVQAVLEQTELAAVGGQLVSSLSTEQGKRLTIAVELVTLPKVLFCDEPTSSLDSRSASLIAGVLQQVAHTGVTVVATIHQPSDSIFARFDDLLLLKRGGIVVFAGAVSDLVGHLEAAPEMPRLRKNENPAAWMMQPGPDLAQHWQGSKLAQAMAAEVDLLCQPQAVSLAQLRPPATCGWLGQLRLLAGRGWASYWRNPGANLGRFAVTLAISLVVASIEWGKGDTTRITSANGVQNALGALYMLASALSVEAAFECQSGIAAARPVYFRERAAGCYTPLAFLLAQVCVEAAYLSVQVILFTTICFFSLQLRLTAGVFAYTLLLVWLTCVVSFLQAQALVHVTPVLALATTCLSVLSNLQGLLSGFTRPLPLAAKAWWPAFFLNPSFYAFLGLGSMVLGSESRTLPDPQAGGAPMSVASYVAAVYGMSSSSFPGTYGSVAMLAALACAFFALSLVGLHARAFNRR